MDLQTWLQLLIVLALGAVSLWGAIPIGLAIGLEPWVAGSAAAMGAALGTLVVLAVGGRIRNHPRRCLLKPLTVLTAPHLGVLWGSGPRRVGAALGGRIAGSGVGVILDAPVGRLLIWMMLGIVLGSAGLTLVATLVISAYQN